MTIYYLDEGMINITVAVKIPLTGRDLNNYQKLTDAIEKAKVKYEKRVGLGQVLSEDREDDLKAELCFR